MELVSPICFIYTFLSSPLWSKPIPITPRQWSLAAAYIIHYSNRAIISPLRTPSRSKSHILVPLAAVLFNVANGSLMGSYLSSPQGLAFIESRQAWVFWGSMVIWAIGLAGNVLHDEILLELRRKAKGKKDGKGEHYAIPYGYLYSYLSYPNYFCEWAEWTGFAIASAPFPFTPQPLASVLNPSILFAPARFFFPALTPPWLFVFNEIVTMLPRAIRGHRWYHQRFAGAYPKERKAVIPFLL